MSAVGAVRGVGARQGRSSILLAARLDGVLPSGLVLKRASGAGSEQIAIAANGTTFVSFFTTGNADVARFHYVAAAGRRMLLVEPARTNELTYSNFADSDVNNVPDNWSVAAGTAGTDFKVIDDVGPHGGDAYETQNGAAASSGVTRSLTLTNAVTYCCSSWLRSVGVGSGERLYALHRGAGVYTFLDVPAGSVDWTRVQASGAQTTGSTTGYMGVETAFTGVCRQALPQIELGSYASTWIPTSGSSASRGAETCQLTAGLVHGGRGNVSFLWCPLWANTDVTGTATLFAWGTNDRIDFDGATDTLRVVNNSATRATSAALSFSRETLHRVRVDYGSFGTRLSIDGVETSDTNAWTAVATVDAHLGSNAAGGNVESAGYGDLLCAA